MKRWQEYSLDPNTPEIYALRQEAIGRARSASLVEDRVEYLCSLVEGRSVLDIGVVEHVSSAADSPAWLHGNLRKHAARCLGVDVLEPELLKLKERGFNVVCADITQRPLAERFDVIVGGEVIEHLDSPGKFMESCAAMLEPAGRLAITAPNPWHANAIVKSCFGATAFVDSADHVAWYEPSVLYELGHRHGLRLERFSGIGGSRPRTLSGRLFFLLRPLLLRLGLRAELFAKSIIYEFVLVGT